jgi:hypothetical protein
VGKYDALASTALALIEKKGAPLVLTRKGVTAFDPITQIETSTNTPHTVKAVVLPPGKGAEYRVGSLAGKNAIEITMAQKGLSIRPQPGDLVQWQGAAWTIFWATTYDPAADGAIYSLAYAER